MTGPMTVDERVEQDKRRYAFLVESIAHLNDNPKIKPYIRHLLIVAQIVRLATPEQVLAAIRKVDEP